MFQQALMASTDLLKPAATNFAPDYNRGADGIHNVVNALDTWSIFSTNNGFVVVERLNSQPFIQDLLMDVAQTAIDTMFTEETEESSLPNLPFPLAALGLELPRPQVSDEEIRRQKARRKAKHDKTRSTILSFMNRVMEYGHGTLPHERVSVFPTIEAALGYIQQRNTDRRAEIANCDARRVKIDGNGVA